MTPQAGRALLERVPEGQCLTVGPEGERLRPLDGAGRCAEWVVPLTRWAGLRWCWYAGAGFCTRHPPDAGTLAVSLGLEGRLGWQMGDGTGLYLGPGELVARRRDRCAVSRFSLPLGRYAGLDFSVDLEGLDENLPPALAAAGITGAALREKLGSGCRPLTLPASEELRRIGGALAQAEEGRLVPLAIVRLEELLLLLWETEPGSHPADRWPREQVRAVAAVHDTLTADLRRWYTIEQLARQHLINTSALKAVFKGVYGQPVAAYMREYRMREAARQLRETDRTVAEIAAAVGYESQGKFARVFREVLGVTPTEYRRGK